VENKIPSYLLNTGHEQHELLNVKRAKLSFLEKTILNSASTVKSIYQQAENAARENFIQKVNPNVKFISLIYLEILISLVGNLQKQVVISALIFLLFLFARVKVVQVYRKIFFLAFIFGFLVTFPASLNIITPGKVIFNLITFDKPSHFWIYEIPQNIGFTENGFKVVLMIFLRVLNSVSIALLIIFTTPFPSFIKSFKIIGVPDTFLMIISLAYKYIYILSRTIEETYFALKSRLAGNIRTENLRNIISGRIFFIFKKSGIIYGSTYFAMVSRGYNGKIKLNSEYHFSFTDWVSLIVIAATGIIIFIF
jgi:cobalt/nickel transport system permease protein